jgi:hypothetical protein
VWSTVVGFDDGDEFEVSASTNNCSYGRAAKCCAIDGSKNEVK